MEEEKIDITISLKKSNYERIEKIVNYCNSHGQFNNKNWRMISADDIIKGAIINELEVIEKYNELANFSNSSKPFQIKNRFKEVMLEKGLRQKDIVEMTGLDKSNISTMLSNKYQPTLDSFFKVWVALGYPSIHEVLYRESE